MTRNTVAALALRESARHNVASEDIERERIKKNYQASMYATDKSYAASLYNADRHLEGVKYSADSSYAASVYSANTAAAASRYAADRNYEANIYSADTHKQVGYYQATKSAAASNYATHARLTGIRETNSVNYQMNTDRLGVQFGIALMNNATNVLNGAMNNLGSIGSIFTMIPK